MIPHISATASNQLNVAFNMGVHVPLFQEKHTNMLINVTWTNIPMQVT